MEEFNASLYVNDPLTGDTALHIACHMLSDLRFYIMHMCPNLALIVDATGTLALHIACCNNDQVFVAWLFSIILEEDTSTTPERVAIPRCTSLPFIDDPRRTYRNHSNSVNVLPAMSIQPWQYRRTASRRKRPAATEPSDHGDSPSTDSSVDLLTSGEDGPLKFGKHLEKNQRDNELRSGSLLSSGGFTLVGSGNHLHELVASIQSARTGILMSSGSSTVQSFSDSTVAQLEDVELLSPEGAMPKKQFPSVTAPPLSLQQIIDLKPFRLTSQGESVLHILARKGNSDILALMLKVAHFFEHNFEDYKVDLSILMQRNSFTQCTPLEEAITHKHVRCLKLLIKFAENIRVIEAIVQDNKLLRSAVSTKDIETVMVLVQFGFYEGLEQAVSLACADKTTDILRLLLYFHTQVRNALEFSRVRRNRNVVLDSGGIKWVGFQLEHVQPLWLDDMYNAIDCVAKVFKLTMIVDSPAKNHKFFRRLGESCLKYYRDFMKLRVISPSAVIAHNLIPIVEVNLSKNQLTCVPPELFQMQSLRILKLMHNALEVLPSADDNPDQPLYTAPHLKAVFLDGNKLQTLPEEMFGGLAASLEELTVTDNELRNLPPGIWVAPRLKILKLGRNHLRSLHYFSSPRYFNSRELSQKIVSCFSLTDGKLERSDSVEQEDLQKLEDYLQKLGAFFRTVHRAVDAAWKFQFQHDLQVLMDVHWKRYNQYSNYPPQSQPNGYCSDEEQRAEVVTVAEEEEQDKSVFQRNHSKLTYLDLSQNEFEEIPWDLPCVAPNLQRLDLRHNQLKELDVVHGIPANISTLLLDHNKIQSLNRERVFSLPCGNPVLLLSLQPQGLGDYCNHCKHRYLDNLTNFTVDQNLLKEFPAVEIFEHSIPSEEGISAFGKVSYQPFFPNLSILSLEGNQLDTFPKNLHHLKHLSSLTLSHNPIVELPLEMGLMNMQALLVLKLEGVYIRNVPQPLLDKPTPKHLISFLKSMLQKSRPYRRIKLMVVGHANKGKTSLLMSMTKRGKTSRFKPVALGHNNRPLSTVGVDLGDWEYGPRGKEKITFMTWDFGGQVSLLYSLAGFGILLLLSTT